jgi:hypothetical protein
MVVPELRKTPSRRPATTGTALPVDFDGRAMRTLTSNSQKLEYARSIRRLSTKVTKAQKNLD